MKVSHQIPYFLAFFFCVPNQLRKDTPQVLYNRATCCHLAACKPFYKAFLCKGKKVGLSFLVQKHVYLFCFLGR